MFVCDIMDCLVSGDHVCALKITFRPTEGRIFVGRSGSPIAGPNGEGRRSFATKSELGPGLPVLKHTHL